MQNAEYWLLRVDEPIVVKADQVLVETGIVWLTQSGHLEDVILLPHQSYCPQRKGKVVIEALGGDAQVSLRCAPRAFRVPFFSRAEHPVSTV